MARKMRIVGGIRIQVLPPPSQILRAYDYDRERCEFLYKRDPGTDRWAVRWNKNVAGTPAGYLDASGYRKLRISKQVCSAHRLVWKVMTGKDPVGLIDHINGIRDDNRIENLRDVTPHQNMLNAVKGRWSEEKRRRKDVEENARAERVETRERALLARLKSKYEHKSVKPSATHTDDVVKPLSVRAIEKRDERDAAPELKT